ncbi:MAG: DUF4143 domain-containing protein [Clostridiales bacterium]|jgi:predicted AAA+ superfamily ATPase|nr:DUF4143 domain-containing protein [Clostridiales bacterium]
MDSYLPRLIDATIQSSLKEVGCVVVEGPKWCGKSTSAKLFAKTIVELQWPPTFNQYKIFASTGDAALLTGETPLMFDEWQAIPELWNYVRAEVDRRGGKGQFILTGSAKPKEDKNRHSGTGRMKRVVMRPMSMWESHDSDGTVSLEALFDGSASASGRAKHNLTDIAKIVCRGGWPAAVTEADPVVAMTSAVNYVDALVTEDIVEIDEIKRDPARARAILRVYARNISQGTRIGTLLSDAEMKGTVADPRTFDSYVNAFKKLYVIEDVAAWSPYLRSKAALRTTDTRQFVDPSVAAVVLGATSTDIMKDLNTFGFLFESMCIRDLRVYSQRLGGTVYNYRDSAGLETDAVIHLNNGKWGAIEIKLGGDSAVALGAKHLLQLREKIDTEQMNPPSFLLVLTATGYAYRRPDGVYVLPIGCLKD